MKNTILIFLTFLVGQVCADEQFTFQLTPGSLLRSSDGLMPPVIPGSSQPRLGVFDLDTPEFALLSQDPTNPEVDCRSLRRPSDIFNESTCITCMQLSLSSLRTPRAPVAPNDSMCAVMGEVYARSQEQCSYFNRENIDSFCGCISERAGYQKLNYSDASRMISIMNNARTTAAPIVLSSSLHGMMSGFNALSQEIMMADANPALRANLNASVYRCYVGGLDSIQRSLASAPNHCDAAATSALKNAFQWQQNKCRTDETEREQPYCKSQLYQMQTTASESIFLSMDRHQSRTFLENFGASGIRRADFNMREFTTVLGQVADAATRQAVSDIVAYVNNQRSPNPKTLLELFGSVENLIRMQDRFTQIPLLRGFRLGTQAEWELADRTNEEQIASGAVTGKPAHINLEDRDSFNNGLDIVIALGESIPRTGTITPEQVQMGMNNVYAGKARDLERKCDEMIADINRTCEIAQNPTQSPLTDIELLRYSIWSPDESVTLQYSSLNYNRLRCYIAGHGDDLLTMSAQEAFRSANILPMNSEQLDAYFMPDSRAQFNGWLSNTGFSNQVSSEDLSLGNMLDSVSANGESYDQTLERVLGTEVYHEVFGGGVTPERSGDHSVIEETTGKIFNPSAFSNGGNAPEKISPQNYVVPQMPSGTPEATQEASRPNQTTGQSARKSDPQYQEITQLIDRLNQQINDKNSRISELESQYARTQEERFLAEKDQLSREVADLRSQLASARSRQTEMLDSEPNGNVGRQSNPSSGSLAGGNGSSGAPSQQTAQSGRGNFASGGSSDMPSSDRGGTNTPSVRGGGLQLENGSPTVSRDSTSGDVVVNGVTLTSSNTQVIPLANFESVSPQQLYEQYPNKILIVTTIDPNGREIRQMYTPRVENGVVRYVLMTNAAISSDQITRIRTQQNADEMRARAYTRVEELRAVMNN